ncbi:ISAs1 family transposase [Pontibacter sp. E15-1]|uniref:ISAs1 family transposase n=1 Tax=Pontibacter sp. E15-1 TaxID=2919918 RepID=UPI001F4FCC27|nr:ISAs1 family transposase [Pontibacter sp. E15-1]MCJ8165657.1 ISAs1 family transposase [Pontibacter sp. E15-1]
MEWQHFFAGVPDFRIERSKLHKRSDILMLSLCAVLCGAEDFEDIATYGRQKEAFLRRFLHLPHGIPSHDTINRAFSRLYKDKFAQSLYNWSGELLGVVEHYQIAVDGKVLRATATPGKRNSGICLVSAWAQEQRLVLGQQRVEGKSNEKTAIPELLEGLELKGAVVSIDAMACHSTVAEQVTADAGTTCWRSRRTTRGFISRSASTCCGERGSCPRTSGLTSAAAG